MDCAALLEPVHFAVLLRAHAISLKLLPGRLEKVLSAETRKMSELVPARHSSEQRIASLIHEQAEKGGEGKSGLISKHCERRSKTNWPNTSRP